MTWGYNKWYNIIDYRKSIQINDLDRIMLIMLNKKKKMQIIYRVALILLCIFDYNEAVLSVRVQHIAHCSPCRQIVLYGVFSPQELECVRPPIWPNSIRNEAAFPAGSGFFAFRLFENSPIDPFGHIDYSDFSMFGVVTKQLKNSRNQNMTTFNLGCPPLSQHRCFFSLLLSLISLLQTDGMSTGNASYDHF